MIQTTIKALLAGEVDTKGYCLYVIRDSDTVFYVGKSQTISSRLWQHLGRDRANGVISTIGQFILLNRPQSGAYQVELFTPQEVLPDSLNYLADQAEQKLIGDLSPCFNVTYNIKPGKLPTKYRDPRSPNLETTISDFVPF